MSVSPGPLQHLTWVSPSAAPVRWSEPSLTSLQPFTLHKVAWHFPLPSRPLIQEGKLRLREKGSPRIPQGSVAKLASESRSLGSGCPHSASHSQRGCSLAGVSGLGVLKACPELAPFQVEGRAQPMQAGLSHGEGMGGGCHSFWTGWRREETETSLLGWAAAREGLCLFFHLPPCSSARPLLTIWGPAHRGATCQPHPHPHPGPNITMS